MMMRAVPWLIGALFTIALSEPAHAQRGRNYCSLPGGSASLMLVDRTSPYSTDGEDRQGERIAAGVDALLDGLGSGDRLTIATIERHRRLSTITFDNCFPGCDESRRNPIPFLNDCPRATIDSERQNFRRRLYRAIIPLLENAQDQPNSDITGTVFQMSAHHRFSRIYIFSDMLENSQVLPWQNFSNRPASESLSAVQRSGFVPTLRGAEIQVVGFGLSHARSRAALTDAQDRTIRDFWRLYFEAAGAEISYRTAIDASER
ncbi:MAG: hypothetical protein DCF16_07520 [Alphaproteobacteria bacterium]|nr:MAG: hypothetical protein DCF16_07520 [Alphaproteobacteria bacterium]